MRFVRKQSTTPEAFLTATTGVAGYHALYHDQKQTLLAVLVDEQAGLCAYCNQAITPKTATIEHWICQSHNPGFDLKYFNLLAVCRGNQGGGVRSSHCDKYRGEYAKNDYFIPFFLFEKCLTTSWDSLNPFFDVEYNPKTQFYSGKIIPRNTNLQGYPNNTKRIREAIEMLNLNAEILVRARQRKWELVLENKEKINWNWYELFSYYLHSPTDFAEYVLLAIRKQAP